MVLKWAEKPVLRQLQLPQHNSHLSYSNATYVNILNSKQYFKMNYSLDDIPDEQKFSLLTINLRLSRDISNKIAGVYIPTALIVTVCFSTFWFGPKSISDRVTVGVTALLAFVTQFIETRKFIPSISYITLVEGTIVHYYYLKGKHQIRLRRKNLKHSLKVFEQGTEQPDQNGNFSKFVNPASSLNNGIGKWKKNREPLTYEPPPPELLINRFKYANNVYRREKFNKRSNKNQVQFDTNVVYLSNGNSPIKSGSLQNLPSLTNQQPNQTDLRQSNYTLESPVPALKNKLIQSGLYGLYDNNRMFDQPKSPQVSSSDNWSQIADTDFRSTLSGAEIRNLDLLQLLNDQSVREWLTETIYPDHVNFGLISLIKHYWKVLFAVDLPLSSPHYHSTKIDKYARVFIPLIYLLCLFSYVVVILTYMELDNEADLVNVFAYKSPTSNLANTGQ